MNYYSFLSFNRVNFTAELCPIILLQSKPKKVNNLLRFLPIFCQAELTVVFSCIFAVLEWNSFCRRCK